MIDTEMMVEVTSDDQCRHERMASSLPIGRAAAADEIAGLVLYLASDESSYSAGSEFVADGGVTAL